MDSYGSNAQVVSTDLSKDVMTTEILTSGTSGNVNNGKIQMNEKILVSLIKFLKTTRDPKWNEIIYQTMAQWKLGQLNSLNWQNQIEIGLDVFTGFFRS